MNIEFDPIEEVLDELRQGHLVIVTDDANRENEGDLILAAEMATPELINFMIRYTSGVICVPMEGKDLDRLELPLMTVRNTESMRTAYTISVDAKNGVTTGISAADRSRTIRLSGGPKHSRSGHGPARSRLSSPVQRGRRAPTGWAYGSCCRPGKVGGTAAGWCPGRGCKRGRLDGEIAGPDSIQA